MKNIHSIEFYTGSKEELLPGFEKDFPYIASRAELDKYIGCYVPWHWHRTVELFYITVCLVIEVWACPNDFAFVVDGFFIPFGIFGIGIGF